jgi:hypothetical protein
MVAGPRCVVCGVVWQRRKARSGGRVFIETKST